MAMVNSILSDTHITYHMTPFTWHIQAAVRSLADNHRELNMVRERNPVVGKSGIPLPSRCRKNQVNRSTFRAVAKQISVQDLQILISLATGLNGVRSSSKMRQCDGNGEVYLI